MILGSILRLKKDDINKEVMILFYLSLFEILVLFSFVCLYTGLLFLMTNEFFIQMLAVLLFIISVVVLYFFYRKIIKGGIYIRKQNKFQAESDDLKIVADVSLCKKESHYLSKFSGDRYDRYYFLLEYEIDGHVYKGRTHYFFDVDEDMMQVVKVNILVKCNNFKEYFSEM